MTNTSVSDKVDRGWLRWMRCHALARLTPQSGEENSTRRFKNLVQPTHCLVSRPGSIKDGDRFSEAIRHDNQASGGYSEEEWSP
ncbi:MAG: hypothetical protein ACLFVK_06565 [Dehalococcoidia bacterium]